MTIGASPEATSVAAARIPAGPAPTITGGLSSIAADLRDDPHALGNEARAGAQPLAVLERHPAILAGAHQAESGTPPVAKFRGPDAAPVGQQRGQQRVTGERLAGTAIDCKADARPILLGEAVELRSCHDLDSNRASPHREEPPHDGVSNDETR